MKKRNVKIGEQRYLVQLEPCFWQSVDKILDEEKITLSFLCTELNRLKTAYSPSKLLRLFTLIYFRNNAEQIQIRHIQQWLRKNQLPLNIPTTWPRTAPL